MPVLLGVVLGATARRARDRARHQRPGLDPDRDPPPLALHQGRDCRWPRRWLIAAAVTASSRGGRALPTPSTATASRVRSSTPRTSCRSRSRCLPSRSGSRPARFPQDAAGHRGDGRHLRRCAPAGCGISTPALHEGGHGRRSASTRQQGAVGLLVTASVHRGSRRSLAERKHSIPSSCRPATNSRGGVLNCLSATRISASRQYQPASHYWQFQWTEAALFLVLAAALVTFADWCTPCAATRKRRAIYARAPSGPREELRWLSPTSTVSTSTTRTPAATGAAVLFSHGFLMDHEMFEPQVAALAGEFRCITWDERGFGADSATGDFTLLGLRRRRARAAVAPSASSGRSSSGCRRAGSSRCALRCERLSGCSDSG